MTHPEIVVIYILGAVATASTFFGAGKPSNLIGWLLAAFIVAMWPLFVVAIFLNGLVTSDWEWEEPMDKKGKGKGDE